MDVLEAVFGPAHVADVREAVAQVPASTRRWLPVEDVAVELGKVLLIPNLARFAAKMFG